MATERVHTDTGNLPKNGNADTAHLSSNATLVWRVFVPVFGTAFLFGFVAAFWFMDPESLYMRSASLWVVRVVVLAIWLGWMLLVYRSIWRLKRVDANDAYLFVTNYWTTARYPWTDVLAIEEKRVAGIRLIALQLSGKGIFGNKIYFLPDTHFRVWLREKNKENLMHAN